MMEPVTKHNQLVLSTTVNRNNNSIILRRRDHLQMRSNYLNKLGFFKNETPRYQLKLARSDNEKSEARDDCNGCNQQGRYLYLIADKVIAERSKKGRHKANKYNELEYETSSVCTESISVEKGEESKCHHHKERVVDHRKANQDERVRFHSQVTVTLIPSHEDYNENTRKKLWSSYNEIKQNMIRNKIEFSADGRCWRTACEEDEMFFNHATGEYIHPVHFPVVLEDIHHHHNGVEEEEAKVNETVSQSSNTAIHCYYHYNPAIDSAKRRRKQKKLRERLQHQQWQAQMKKLGFNTTVAASLT